MFSVAVVTDVGDLNLPFFLAVEAVIILSQHLIVSRITGVADGAVLVRGRGAVSAVFVALFAALIILQIVTLETDLACVIGCADFAKLHTRAVTVSSFKVWLLPNEIAFHAFVL